MEGYVAFIQGQIIAGNGTNEVSLIHSHSIWTVNGSPRVHENLEKNCLTYTI